MPVTEARLDGPTRAVADRVATELPLVEAGGRLGVAFSGGVDSAALTAVAVWALGPSQVVALLGVSESLARREQVVAHQVASQIGVEVVEVETFEQTSEAYRRNDVDRCYHCKDELFSRIDESVAGPLGLVAVAYGENADDAVRPDRMGSRAATEHAVLRPLAAAQVTKAEVRALARAFGLSVADKPAAPCLASRIPHGSEVTPEKLRQIDDAEVAVLAAGFSDCRVRHHGTIARIEVPAAELGLLGDALVRDGLLSGVRAAGFRYATFDVAGIQSGGFTLPLLQVGGLHA